MSPPSAQAGVPAPHPARPETRPPHQHDRRLDNRLHQIQGVHHRGAFQAHSRKKESFAGGAASKQICQAPSATAIEKEFRSRLRRRGASEKWPSAWWKARACSANNSQGSGKTRTCCSGDPTRQGKYFKLRAADTLSARGRHVPSRCVRQSSSAVGRARQRTRRSPDCACQCSSVRRRL